MISCDKAATYCDKAQYNDASWLQILLLKIHLKRCKFCAAHSKKNSALTVLCKNANLHSLTDEEKQQIKTKLNQEV